MRSQSCSSALLSGGVCPSRRRRAPRQAATAATLPARLTDAEFWRLTVDLSEPNGFFRSENLVSNEHTYQYVIPALEQVREAGRRLSGRRARSELHLHRSPLSRGWRSSWTSGAAICSQHLMYKAIFELSADRAEFVSRLFSKKRPAGIGAKSSVVELFTAFDRVRRVSSGQGALPAERDDDRASI